MQAYRSTSSDHIRKRHKHHKCTTLHALDDQGQIQSAPIIIMFITAMLLPYTTKKITTHTRTKPTNRPPSFCAVFVRNGQPAKADDVLTAITIYDNMSHAYVAHNHTLCAPSDYVWAPYELHAGYALCVYILYVRQAPRGLARYVSV